MEKVSLRTSRTDVTHSVSPTNPNRVILNVYLQKPYSKLQSYINKKDLLRSQREKKKKEVREKRQTFYRGIKMSYFSTAKVLLRQKMVLITILMLLQKKMNINLESPVKLSFKKKRKIWLPWWSSG